MDAELTDDLYPSGLGLNIERDINILGDDSLSYRAYFNNCSIVQRCDISILSKEQLLVLLRFSKILITQSTPVKCILTTLRTLKTNLNVDLVEICYPDKETSNLVIHYMVKDGILHKKELANVGSGVFSSVFSTGDIVKIDYCTTDSRFVQLYDQHTDVEVNNILLCPLFDPQKVVWGVAAIANISNSKDIVYSNYSTLSFSTPASESMPTHETSYCGGKSPDLSNNQALSEETSLGYQKLPTESNLTECRRDREVCINTSCSFAESFSFSSHRPLVNRCQDEAEDHQSSFSSNESSLDKNSASFDDLLTDPSKNGDNLILVEGMENVEGSMSIVNGNGSLCSNLQHSLDGATSVAASDRVVWDNNNITFILQICETGGQCIANAIHWRELDATKERANGLLTLMHSLFSDRLGIQSCVVALTTHARKLLQAERCTVYIVDRCHNHLWSISSDDGSQIIAPLTHGLAAECVSSGEVIVVENAYGDERFDSVVDSRDGVDIRNVAWVPIKSEDCNRVLAVIEVINKQAEELLHFGEDDLRILEIFATIVGPQFEKSDFASFGFTDKTTEAGLAFENIQPMGSTSLQRISENSILETEED